MTWLGFVGILVGVMIALLGVGMFIYYVHSEPAQIPYSISTTFIGVGVIIAVNNLKSIRWLGIAGILAIIMGAIIAVLGFGMFFDAVRLEPSIILVTILASIFGVTAIFAGNHLTQMRLWAWWYLLLFTGLQFCLAIAIELGFQSIPTSGRLWCITSFLIYIPILITLVVANPWRWKTLAAEERSEIIVPDKSDDTIENNTTVQV